jgi:hypothetical protein
VTDTNHDDSPSMLTFGETNRLLDRAERAERRLAAALKTVEAAKGLRARWPNIREDAAAAFDAALVELARVMGTDGPGFCGACNKLSCVCDEASEP